MNQPVRLVRNVRFVRTLARTGLAPALALALAVAALAPPPAARAAETQAIVYTTDFGSGAISTVGFGPPRKSVIDRANVCSDAVLRWSFGHLAVIERFNCDGIRLLDPATWNVIRQFSVGVASNPNDYYETSPTKAYVSRYDSSTVWIVDPSTGAHTGTIPMTAFADHDGIPEMNRMAYYAGRLFVSCQRLDRDNFFSPTDSSVVAVIDCAADTLVDCDPAAPGVQGILLPLTNPTTEFALTPEGDFLLGCTGNYGVNDGGIVRLDPRTLHVAVEAREADLGGDVNAVAVGPGASGATKAFCVISDASFNTVLVSYARATGLGVHTVRAGSGFVYADIGVSDRNELWLCDRTPQAPGMRVFAAANDSELTTGPIGTGLPPQDLVFDVTDPVGVGPGPGGPGGAAGVAFVNAAPNPSWGGGAVALALTVDRPGTVRLAILDARGRLVRAFTREIDRAGAWSCTWDGKGGDGFPAASGVYYVRATLSGRSGAASIRLVRLSSGSHS
jgi:hypothetical protein